MINWLIRQRTPSLESNHELPDRIMREKLLSRAVEQLNRADGGYHGWTTKELLEFIKALNS